MIAYALAINCILGEAGNQGEAGMDALAHALANRGYTQGVYGCKDTSRESEKTRLIASNAWEAVSRTPDPTRGATHWGNKQDLAKFAKCKWFKSYRQTVKIKDHYFFKIKSLHLKRRG
jgi:hypothetical protein